MVAVSFKPVFNRRTFRTGYLNSRKLKEELYHETSVSNSYGRIKSCPERPRSCMWKIFHHLKALRVIILLTLNRRRGTFEEKATPRENMGVFSRSVFGRGEPNPIWSAASYGRRDGLTSIRKGPERGLMGDMPGLTSSPQLLEPPFKIHWSRAGR